MKKITALISALLITLNCINVSAIVNNDYTNETQIDGIVFTEGSENAEVTISSGNLLLDASVGTDTQKTGAYFISPLIGIDESDDIFNFTCNFEITATDNLTANRYIQLAYGDCSSLSSVEKITLINITKNKVRVGSSNKDYVAVNNGMHMICGYVNLADKKITVYYDGVAIAENQNISLSSDFDISTARLMFSNSFTPSAENQYSKWYLQSYLASSHNSQNTPVIRTIADDLGVLNSSSLADGFYINFGAGLKTEPTVVLYEAYGTQDEREIEINSSFNGYMINISPKNEVYADMKSYTAVVNGISYVSGETINEKEFNFTTLSGNYEMPTIEITSPENGATFRTGETVEIVTEVTLGSEEIEKVEVLINNEVIDTLSNGGNSEWIPINAGNYEIKAVVTDALGSSAESVINVAVTQNSVPTVQIDVNDNAVLSMTDTIAIQATDNDGDVEYIEIYSNDELIETINDDNATFDVGKLENGNHNLLIKAYDNEGGIGTASVNISVAIEIVTEYVNEDFETFTAETKSIPGCYFYSKGGYVEPVIIDAEHGTSFSIGTTQEHFENAGNKRDILFEVFSKKEYDVYKAVLEFDIMINNANVGTMVRGNTAEEPDVVNGVSVGPLSIKGNSVTFGGQTMSVADDKWYHVKFIIDTKNSFATLELEGNGNKIEGKTSIDSRLNRISDLIRLTFVLNDKTRSDFKVVLDNLKFSKVVAMVSYQKPDIEIVSPENDTTIMTGETVEIVTELTSGSEEIEKVELLINDEVIDTPLDGGTSEWVPKNVGTYEIKAVVTDVLGVRDESIINVTVIQSPIPIVYHDVINNSVLGLTDTINIQATDNDGKVEFIKIFSNDELIETFNGDNASFVVGKLANGNHKLVIKAYDNDGRIGTASVDIKVSEEIITEYVNEDFETFTAETKSIPGCYFYSKGGYVEPVIIDAEHGTSFSIGTTQEHFENAGNKRDILFEVFSKKEYDVYKAVLEFDIMINNANVGTMVRGNTAEEPDVVNGVSVGPLSIKGNSVTFGGQTMSVVDDKWYHVKFVVDTKNSIATLEFEGNGNKIEGKTDIDNKLDRISDVIRLTFGLNDKARNDFKVVLDNVNFTKISELPTVTGITGKDDIQLVDYSSECIKVSMNGNVSKINADDIMLYNNNGEQKVSKIVIDESNPSILYVYPESDLMSGDNYTLKIKGGVVTDAGTYTNDTISEFTTSPKPFDVLEGDVEKTENSISFTTSFTNTTGETQYSTMLLVLYKDGVFDSIIPKVVEISNTSKIDTVSLPVTTGNYTAYGLIVDEIGGMLPESNKLFELK